MRRGARSIRGALGAYLTASLVALAALGLALWLAWPSFAGRGTQVELAADSGWTQAALDDGRRQYSLEPGRGLEVPPGDYRLTLLGPDGRTESRHVAVGTESLVVR